MSTRTGLYVELVRFTSLALMVFAAAAPALAEDGQASSLPVAQARGFLGEWVLTVETADGPQNLLLKFLDVNGKLGATLQAPEQTEPQVITDITESSLKLKLRYARHFGETETGMELVVRLLDEGTLTGTLADDLGTLGPTPDSVAKQRGLGLFGANVRGEKGGSLPTRALVSLGEDTVKVTVGNLRTGDPDAERLAQLKDGEVFRFTSTRAAKLFTDADLKFGEVVIEAGNAGESYPGVYSLWLKKAGDGWRLVFNEEADIWGTMHNPEADVAEIPITHRLVDQEQQRLVVGVEPQGEGGVIKLALGKDEWSAPFVVAQ